MRNIFVFTAQSQKSKDACFPAEALERLTWQFSLFQTVCCLGARRQKGLLRHHGEGGWSGRLRNTGRGEASTISEASAMQDLFETMTGKGLRLEICFIASVVDGVKQIHGNWMFLPYSWMGLFLPCQNVSWLLHDSPDCYAMKANIIESFFKSSFALTRLTVYCGARPAASGGS